MADATILFLNSSSNKPTKMKSVQPKVLAALLLLLFIAGTLLFQNCKPDDCDEKEPPEPCTNCAVVYKPNIYIYPEAKTQLEVTLGFPKGGKVVASIPEYRAGWNVSVDKNGLIDNTFGYLFYESSQPDVWQLTDGWVVKQTDLKDFFVENMTLYGFAGAEINDFTDYWIPKLVYAESFEIYPQNKQLIESVIQLNISKKPDHLLRLFYVVKPSNRPSGYVLSAPKIENSFKREGFFVTEWGVVLK
jgi:hypothetical protein